MFSASAMCLDREENRDLIEMLILFLMIHLSHFCLGVFLKMVVLAIMELSCLDLFLISILNLLHLLNYHV